MKSRHFSIFTAITAVALMAGCGWGTDKSTSDLNRSFAEVMGFAPTPAVTEIKSSWRWIGSAYNKWLMFHCDDSTIAMIQRKAKVKSTAFNHDADAPGEAHREANPKAPQWWVAPGTPITLEEYELNISAETEAKTSYIWIDRKGHTIWAVQGVVYQ